MYALLKLASERTWGMSKADPSRDREGAVKRPFPLAYLITFTCYGTRLHGNGRQHPTNSCEGNQ